MKDYNAKPLHARASNRDMGARGFGGGAKACTDLPLHLLAALLFLAMGLAMFYHLKYARVDESVTVGRVRIVERTEEGQQDLLSLSVGEDMRAVVHYRDWRLRGKLTLRGAETDTILFQLFDAEFLGVVPSASTEQDDAESSAPILFVRMPRSGLQGTYVGPWMVYFSYEDADLLSSDWVFIGEDGTAKIGYSEYLNAMTMTRGNLMEKTTTISWEETSEGVLLNAEV